MSETTNTIGLPYIMPAQAQKHVTHNEALQRLDGAVQLVITATLDAEPDAPQEGDCYAIGPAASGAWSGKAGRLAIRQDGAWLYLSPRVGWRAYRLDAGAIAVFDGAAWAPLPLPATGRFEQLGINAAPDQTNRLAVAAPASLFTHGGDSHRMVINKNATGDTATLLFQSGWSGRAELGLAGSDGFSLKISDGADWLTALAIGSDGVVETGQRPLVRAGLTIGAQQPAANLQSGFDTLYLARGFTLGAALSSGLGKPLNVARSGYYCVVLLLTASGSGAFSARLLRNGTETLGTVSGTADSNPGLRSLSTICWLNGGDGLTVGHAGAASIDFSYGRTELSAYYI
ncbi:DUF2793 domain-containing protein [Rhizobium halophytocola]|uniref:DUF2793 domain-containing protein n=1 Tax=Rhizobium halophytocola TaxID=735519 RepID=A0ABS4DSP2_9HYPH|nr:DUF2793 domain-containing protein [Rhizobium halophytocola]MBP1848715.1 hypothetical protein [Rhizobium halophytocola]